MSANEYDQYIHDEHGPPRWRFSLQWVGLLLLCLFVYEIILQPELAIAVACLKFGWKDYRTGQWLFDVDPRPARGRALFWFHIALGMLKVFVAGLSFSLA